MSAFLLAEAIGLYDLLLRAYVPSSIIQTPGKWTVISDDVSSTNGYDDA